MDNIEDEIEKFENLLKKAQSSKVQGFAWTIENDIIIKIPLVIKSFNKEKRKISFSLDFRTKDHVSNLIGGSGLLKFYFPSDKVLFAAEVSSYKEINLEINYPKEFVQKDRRKDQRFEPLLPIYIEYLNIKKECFDISTGGVSFVVSTPDLAKLKIKENEEYSMKVHFPFGELKVAVSVVKIQKVEMFEVERFPYGSKRVSLQVMKNKKYKEYIVKLISEIRGSLIDLL